MGIGSSAMTMAILLKLTDQMSGPMRDAANSAKKDLDALAEKARQVGERFEAFGRNASAFGLALGAGVQQTVSSFSRLEDASAQLKSTLMTDQGVSENFEAINNLAIELGNRLPGTTADFAGMLSKLLQLGVTEKAILGGVGEAAANLAVVMKLPYEQAAEVAAKLKEATGTSEADMLKFMDTIQRVGHQGVQTGEMMYAFARSAGALKQFDIQGVDQANKIASVYAQLLKTGASGETVGTGMSSVLNRMLMFDNQSTKSAINAAESLKKLGIEIDFFDDKTGQFRGVDNMIAQLDKLKGLNQSQLGDVLNDMFGSGQDSQFVALLAQGGVAANKAVQQSMAAQADINARVGVQLDTLSAKWEAATGTFENLLAKIGETMAPKLGEIVDWFGKISEAAQHLVEDNKELFGWLGLGVAGAAGALVVGGGMALAIGSTLKMIADLMLALKGLSTFLLANPMVLTILGVAAAGAAGYAFGNYIGLDEVGAKLGRALFDVVQSLKKGWATMKATLAQWRQLGVDIIEGLWAGIQATIRKPLDAIGDLAKKLPAWAKDLLGIKSPSRVFMAIGQDIGRGLVVGIGDSEDAVREAVEGLGEVAIYAGDAVTMAMIRAQEDAIEELTRQVAAGAVDVIQVGQPGRVRNLDGTFGTRAMDDVVRGVQKARGPIAAAFEQYSRGVGDFADNMREAFSRGIKGMEDALVDFVRTGKLDFRSLADSIISDLIRIQIQENITKPLASIMSSFDFGSLFGFANGGAPGGVSAWRNQIVDRPTFFAFANGGVMGEAGPEAIMPLRRGPDGRLGVDAAGAGVTVNVINNASGTQATARERSDGGNRIIDVVIEQVKSSIAGDISRGAGPIPGALAGTYGLNRVAGAY